MKITAPVLDSVSVEISLHVRSIDIKLFDSATYKSYRILNFLQQMFVYDSISLLVYFNVCSNGHL